MQRQVVSVFQESLYLVDALRQELSTRLRVLHPEGMPFHVDQFGKFARRKKPHLCCKTSLGDRTSLHVGLRWRQRLWRALMHPLHAFERCARIGSAWRNVSISQSCGGVHGLH